MMKKLTVILLTLAMLTTMTACRKAQTNPDTTTTQPTEATDNTPKPDSALQIMENIWAQFSEEERFFAAGGDGDAMVEDGPGNFSVDNAEGLTYQLLVPEAQVANIREAASLMHAMNSNTFTGAAFRLKDSTKTDDFAKVLRDAIQSNQWLSG